MDKLIVSIAKRNENKADSYMVRYGSGKHLCPPSTPDYGRLPVKETSPENNKLF